MASAKEIIDAAKFPARREDKSVESTAEAFRVVDGDTLYVTRMTRTDDDECILKHLDLRLAHIDTPELKGPTIAERTLAHEARNFTLSLVQPGDIVTIYDLGPDKYGRRLAQVNTQSGVNVGEALLQAGLAAPYGERPWRA